MRRMIARRRGVTLIELVVAMTVFSMIGVVISATFFAAMRVWRRCSSQSQADPPAHLAIRRLTTELKNAYMVNSIGTSTITFTIPRTDRNGVNIVPFEPARRVCYYMSDATGEVGRTGTVLWRKETNVQTGAVRTGITAENVESLNFSYEATTQRVLDIYAMSITVMGREGRETYRSEFASHVAFRN